MGTFPGGKAVEVDSNSMRPGAGSDPSSLLVGESRIARRLLGFTASAVSILAD